MNIKPEWKEVGCEDPKTRLLAEIEVEGMPMHLDAIQVEGPRDEDLLLHAVNDEYDQIVSDIQFIEDAALRTAEIGGREYLIYATPYGR
ncbi:hypothetical protein GQE99_06560 [Maritimibacter sp. DP07]|uniref:Uncharacterized protein n=1 Tax=Maritimibacter harenae TaxID=2606218 RepID=A0A845M8P5_9RHOB|nr:hypothetical protein [Maritimibacter harenae]MZR12681.1 hypothetical protein [Maritimibacter harenae]